MENVCRDFDGFRPFLPLRLGNVFSLGGFADGEYGFALQVVCHLEALPVDKLQQARFQVQVPEQLIPGIVQLLFHLLIVRSQGMLHNCHQRLELLTEVSRRLMDAFLQMGVRNIIRGSLHQTLVLPFKLLRHFDHLLMKTPGFFFISRQLLRVKAVQVFIDQTDITQENLLQAKETEQTG